jgi:hypothetical protein
MKSVKSSSNLILLDCKYPFVSVSFTLELWVYIDLLVLGLVDLYIVSLRLLPLFVWDSVHFSRCKDSVHFGPEIPESQGLKSDIRHFS